MNIVIVGCGRVGSSVARTMLKEGHEVSCLDEDPEAHARLEVNLEKSWEDAGGHFTVGTALEIDALTSAGIERADAFIASTEGYVHAGSEPTIEDVAEHWATINDETGHYIPADLPDWSAAFMAHLRP